MMRRQKETVKKKAATTCVHVYAWEMRRGCSVAVGRRLRQARCGAVLGGEQQKKPGALEEDRLLVPNCQG